MYSCNIEIDFDYLTYTSKSYVIILICIWLKYKWLLKNCEEDEYSDDQLDNAKYEMTINGLICIPSLHRMYKINTFVFMS